jgi:hypothetical protein
MVNLPRENTAKLIKQAHSEKVQHGRTCTHSPGCNERLSPYLTARRRPSTQTMRMSCGTARTISRTGSAGGGTSGKSGRTEHARGPRTDTPSCGTLHSHMLCCNSYRAAGSQPRGDGRTRSSGRPGGSGPALVCRRPLVLGPHHGSLSWHGPVPRSTQSVAPRAQSQLN